MYEHILVALDGSANAEKVLPNVQAIAEKFGSTITLLRAVASPEELALAVSTAPVIGQPLVAYPIAGIDPTEMSDAERDDAGRYLAQISAHLTSKGLQVATVEPEGPPADAILNYAREHNCNLIAMTTHGRGGLGRLIMGSVADDVLRRSYCPLLLVRIHEEEKPDESGGDSN